MAKEQGMRERKNCLVRKLPPGAPLNCVHTSEWDDHGQCPVVVVRQIAEDTIFIQGAMR